MTQAFPPVHDLICNILGKLERFQESL